MIKTRQNWTNWMSKNFGKNVTWWTSDLNTSVASWAMTLKWRMVGAFMPSLHTSQTNMLALRPLTTRSLYSIYTTKKESLSWSLPFSIGLCLAHKHRRVDDFEHTNTIITLCFNHHHHTIIILRRWKTMISNSFGCVLVR